MHKCSVEFNTPLSEYGGNSKKDTEQKQNDVDHNNNNTQDVVPEEKVEEAVNNEVSNTSSRSVAEHLMLPVPTMIPIHYTSEGLAIRPKRDEVLQLGTHPIQQCSLNKASVREEFESIIDTVNEADKKRMNTNDTHASMIGVNGYFHVPIDAFSTDTESWNVFPLNTISEIINSPPNNVDVIQNIRGLTPQTEYVDESMLLTTIDVEKETPEENNFTELMARQATMPHYSTELMDPVITTGETINTNTVSIDITEYEIPREVICLSKALLHPSLTIEEYIPLGLRYAIPLKRNVTMSNATNTPSSQVLSPTSLTLSDECSMHHSCTGVSSVISTSQKNDYFLYDLIPGGSDILVPFGERGEFARRVMIEHNLCETVKFNRAIDSVTITAVDKNMVINNNKYDTHKDIVTLPRSSSVLKRAGSGRYGVLSYFPLKNGGVSPPIKALQGLTPVLVPISHSGKKHSLSSDTHLLPISVSKRGSTEVSYGLPSVPSPWSPQLQTLEEDTASSIPLTRQGTIALLALRDHIRQLSFLDFKRMKTNSIDDGSQHRHRSPIRHSIHSHSVSGILRVKSLPLAFTVENGMDSCSSSDAIIDVLSSGIDSDSDLCTTSDDNEEIIDEESKKMWASFRLAYCLRIPNSFDTDVVEGEDQETSELKSPRDISSFDTKQQNRSEFIVFDLVPHGHKIPVHINDRHHFIALALNKIDDILERQKRNSILEDTPNSNGDVDQQQAKSDVNYVFPSSHLGVLQENRNIFSNVEKDGDEVYNLPEDQKRLFSPGHLGNTMFAPPQPMTIANSNFSNVTLNKVNPERSTSTSPFSVGGLSSNACDSTDGGRGISLTSLLPACDQQCVRGGVFSPSAAAALLVAGFKSPRLPIFNLDTQIKMD